MIVDTYIQYLKNGHQNKLDDRFFTTILLLGYLVGTLPMKCSFTNLRNQQYSLTKLSIKKVSDKILSAVLLPHAPQNKGYSNLQIHPTTL